MPVTDNSFKRIYAIIAAVIGWFGLLLQLYLLLSLADSGISTWGRFFNFFSYFTITTNILAACSLTLTAYKSRSKTGEFFTLPVVQSAIALYLIIVGIIYITILQKLWQPQGLHWLADFILHYSMPAIFLIYWLLFVPKGSMRWKHCFLWLIYPAVYFVYSLIRGSFTNWYPYPFVNVSEHGYDGVLKNAGLLMIAFLLACHVFLGIDSVLARSRKPDR